MKETCNFQHGIKSPEITTEMTERAVNLKENSPIYLNSLLKSEELPNTEYEMTINGGRASACYIVRHKGDLSILKFVNDDPTAEITALGKWEDQGVIVPKILQRGKVSADDLEGHPYYFLMEAILGEDRKLAPPGDEYIANGGDPAKLGSAFGESLFKMHQAKADPDSKVGSFGMGEVPKFNNNSENFQDAIESRQDLSTPEQRNKILRDINSADIIDPFIKVYCDNDSTYRNILVKSENPFQIAVIDPIVGIGDPYTDLGLLHNSRDIYKMGNLSKNEALIKFYDAIISSYTKQSGKLESKRLSINRIVAAIKVAGFFEKFPNKGDAGKIRAILDKLLISYS
jgi:aminoglycoside phosphotransferase (APT) family kinase protein